MNSILNSCRSIPTGKVNGKNSQSSLITAYDESVMSEVSVSVFVFYLYQVKTGVLGNRKKGWCWGCKLYTGNYNNSADYR